MKIAIHWRIIIGLVLGLGWAIASSYLGWSEFTLNWIDPFGKIFINLLKMIAVPLVLFSIIKGVADLKDITKLGKVGLKTLGVYLITTLFAISLGLSLANIGQPGKSLTDEQLVENRIKYELWAQENKVDLIDDINLLKDPAYKDQIATINEKYLKEKEENAQDASLQAKSDAASKQKDARPLQFLVDIVPTNIFGALTDVKNMLQVIFFGILFGIALLMIPKESSGPVSSLITGINDTFLKMVDIIMNAAPYFVFALMAGNFSDLAKDDPQKLWDSLFPLLEYSLLVLIGLALMIFVIYPVIMLIVTKKNGQPMSYTGFFKRISPAQFLAFSTSSSAATLPVTIECVRDRIGVSKEVTSFVLPIGATVNMDGTSLYQAVAAIFLAQSHMIDLTFGAQMEIMLLALLASIGSAAVPSAGIVMLMIVLSSVGLNPAWIVPILAVDRILDMCRTVVNVTGDATVATIIASTEKELNIVPDEILDQELDHVIDEHEGVA
ncbi:dicarboxylate/amino acid:cation symporter [Parvicella tangerina]|uniref:Proton/glutamate-aspartate symporter n=1 Tax=Parvicella tangerina TaxID=2829795 RepID=A0A916JKJ1_9FLAO|nr:dicarboxylate/amino acid:cation symporter [Parvicella tangerina]CAG5078949.1 Proton/glutamate-aspartate symporter [Parvicella tangerina]